jgi:hypothetical protein
MSDVRSQRVIEASIPMQWLVRKVSMASNMHTTVEELLFHTKPHKEIKRDMKQSR